MNNPLTILQELDKHLKEKTELIIFGKSAIVLGFPSAPGEYGSTMDVDGIIPMEMLDALGNNEKIRRPSTLDLILTKMMRGDDADLAEIGFLIKTGDIRLADLEAAYRIARVPIPEIGEIFLRSQTAVRKIYEIPPVAGANP
jgi:hypothetical protein